MAQTLEFTEQETARLIRLGCQVIHRAAQARKHSKEGNPSHALAEYYAMDTELLGRVFNILPADVQAQLLAGSEDGPGK